MYLNIAQTRTMVSSYVISLILAFSMTRAVALERSINARSIEPFQISFEPGQDVQSLTLEFSLDGATYFPFSCGIPGEPAIFITAKGTDRNATAIAPLVAYFGPGNEVFLFDRPGRYWLRWRIGAPDVEDSVGIEQTVDVTETTPADQAMLNRLSDPNLIRRLFGAEFFEKLSDTTRARFLGPQGADARALLVIREIQRGSNDVLPEHAVFGRKSPEEMQAWGEALFEIAKDVPDSSYAPYAAYYSGCCGSQRSIGTALEAVRRARIPGQRKDRAAEAAAMAALMKEDGSSNRALEAFSFAVERGDVYLKPRALCQRAFLKALIGERNEYEELLTQALTESPGTGTINDWVTEIRAELLKRENPPNP